MDRRESPPPATLSSFISDQFRFLPIPSLLQPLQPAIKTIYQHTVYLAMRPIQFLKQAFITTCVAIALVGTIALVPLILPITFPLIFLSLIVLLVLVLLALLITLLVVLVLLIQNLPRLLKEDFANAASTSASTQTQGQTQNQIQGSKGRTTSVSSSVHIPRVGILGMVRPEPCHEHETDTFSTANQPSYPSFGIDSPRKNRQFYA